MTIPPRGKRGKSRQLVTQKDAGEYITKLPKAEHSGTEWQTVMEALLLAAGGALTPFARIMKALHRHEKHQFNLNFKEHHRGKRKLARDRRSLRLAYRSRGDQAYRDRQALLGPSEPALGLKFRTAISRANMAIRSHCCIF
jgi:hypothetical protein